MHTNKLYANHIKMHNAIIKCSPRTIVQTTLYEAKASTKSLKQIVKKTKKIGQVLPCPIS